MAWSSLSNRLVSLPKILCGPIVRKVTRNSVSVFIVTKEKLGKGMGIKIFATGADLSKVGLVIPSTNEVVTKKFGDNLYFSMFTAKFNPSNTLGENKKYFYNILLNENENLVSPGVINVLGGYQCSITYNNEPIPSFKTPPNLIKDVRLFHGSCRKMVGEGSDALAYIDEDMKLNANSAERPQYLFMTGDQIYADDLSDSLLAMLIDAENTLIKPYHTDKAKQSVFKQDMFDLVPGKRSNYLSGKRGLPKPIFDSGAIFSNQLVTFGEFIISYLMAWSDVLWPAPDSNNTQYMPDINDIGGIVAKCMGGASYRSSIDNPFGETANQYRDKCYYEHNYNLLVFRSSLNKVRRVLANIPTYMIFDDHEISDDWNISYFWYNNIDKSSGPNINPFDSSTNPLKSFIANGMSAYAVMQDWGNQPEEYTNKVDKVDLLYNLETATRGATDSQSSWKTIIDKIFPKYRAFDVSTKNKGSLEHNFKWYYKMDFTDYCIRVLDSRTLRRFDEKRTMLISNQDEVYSNANSKDYFSAQISRPPELRTVIIIAPCPLFSAIPQTSQMQSEQNLIKNLTDYEAWNNHAEYTNQVLHQLGRAFENVIALSGDVHYGYTMGIILRTLNSNGQNYRNIHFVQCTSSSMKNQSTQLMSFKKDLEKKEKNIGYGWKSRANAGVIYPTSNEDFPTFYEWFNLDDLPSNAYPLMRVAIPDVQVHIKNLKNTGNNSLLNYSATASPSNSNPRTPTFAKDGSAKVWKGVVEVNHIKKLSFARDINGKLKSKHDFYYKIDNTIKNFMTHQWNYVSLLDWHPSPKPDLF